MRWRSLYVENMSMVTSALRLNIQLYDCAFWPDQRRVPAMDKSAGRCALMIDNIITSIILDASERYIPNDARAAYS